MRDVRDLIRRARELARLGEWATPGPWSVVECDKQLDLYRVSGPTEIDYVDGDYLTGVDAELIAAAPDMAALLRQLADALEDAREEAIREATDLVTEAIKAIKCDACAGRGRVSTNRNSQACPVCDGSGIADDPIAALEDLL